MLITRTGWVYEYVDKLCLSRALRLLEYWRREAEAQLKAMRQANKIGNHTEDNWQERSEWMPPDEALVMAQFNMMPRASAESPGMEAGVSRMPPEMRELIDWAESEKAKRGMN